jgi:ATP-dependent 26S proteasome regulatory subunit
VHFPAGTLLDDTGCVINIEARETVMRSALSELLQAMDIKADTRILTLASTNDAATLDKAAIRTGRFDSVVEIGYPSCTDAARILAALIRHIPVGHPSTRKRS